MKHRLNQAIVAGTFVFGLFFADADAQSFQSGSDGSYGPLEITAHTRLQVPPDGIFHCTTISIASSRTLTFSRNALNTPVYLLATGDVEVFGTIDVSGSSGNRVSGGAGGPGGFDGGNPASLDTPAGAGYGPGAGLPGANSRGDSDVNSAGAGVYASVPGNFINVEKTGKPYGSPLLIPLLGGSGGGGTDGNPGYGGAGGGGGILIASDTSIILRSGSRILAVGGRASGSSWNQGSGGGVRLVAPVVAGGGTITVDGSVFGGSSSVGRIRIDTLNRENIAFNFQPDRSTSIGSLMTVFPAPQPRLLIAEVAGELITDPTQPVVKILPFGASPDQTVTVQAEDFGAVLNIEVVLTPDSGERQVYPVALDNLAQNPASVTVEVQFPANVQTTVNAWTVPDPGQ